VSENDGFAQIQSGGADLRAGDSFCGRVVNRIHRFSHGPTQVLHLGDVLHDYAVNRLLGSLQADTLPIVAD
jgi:hypothetical protein